MSCNRFGTFLGLAHAAMTAEGDNSVLMQKVAKERLSALQKEVDIDLKTPQNQDLDNQDYLIYLLKLREMKLFEKLGGKMKSLQDKSGVFNTWMMEESDLIQASARAYADRLIAESFQSRLNEADGDLKPFLSRLFLLYLTSTIEGNMAEMMLNKVITSSQVKKQVKKMLKY